ncbi:hypothetical protein, partial [Brachyspira pilosicoli]
TVNDEINNALNNYLESESFENNNDNLENIEIKENIDTDIINNETNNDEVIDELEKLDDLVENLDNTE